MIIISTNGKSIYKEVVYVYVKGTRQEIDWLLKNLANGCENCPYVKECNEQAELDVKRNVEGCVTLTCASFLNQCIQYQIVDEENTIYRIE